MGVCKTKNKLPQVTFPNMFSYLVCTTKEDGYSLLGDMVVYYDRSQSKLRDRHTPSTDA